MTQKLSSENLKTLEGRPEMILAHEKFGVKIRNVQR